MIASNFPVLFKYKNLILTIIQYTRNGNIITQSRSEYFLEHFYFGTCKICCFSHLCNTMVVFFFFFSLYGVGTQACSNFIYSSHLFQGLPLSWHFLGLCCTLWYVWENFHLPFYPSGLLSIVCLHVFNFILTIFSSIF